MILGIGSDIVQVDRMRRGLARFGERFALRILSESELVTFSKSVKQAHYLARRFAAKEATVKALGTGFSQGVYLSNIEIAHDVNGKPLVKLTGKASCRAEQLGASFIHLSISDEKDYALAFVIMSS